MDPVKGLTFLATALKKGSAVREEIITEVNNLSSAIASACIYTSMRFNQALLASSKADKLDILIQMSQGEIESHARMNGMCAPIFHAANELQRFYSQENLNRRLGKKDDLLDLLESLRGGERDMQRFMMEFMDMSHLMNAGTEKEIDNYIRQRLQQLQNLAKSAQECQFTISSLL